MWASDTRSRVVFKSRQVGFTSTHLVLRDYLRMRLQMMEFMPRMWAPARLRPIPMMIQFLVGA